MTLFQFYCIKPEGRIHWFTMGPVILLPAHPASFAHNFVSGMQSFYFSESQVAFSIADLSLKIVFWTLKFAVGLIDTWEIASPRTHK